VLAWSACGLATAAAVAAALVAHRSGSGQQSGRLADLLVIATASGVGALVVTRRPGHRGGRTLVLAACSGPWAH